MSILAVSPSVAAAPAIADVPTPPAVDAVARDPATAPAAGLAPNPRIEFDPKLGVAVLEYQDAATHSVTYYPSVARQDFSPSDWDVSA